MSKQENLQFWGKGIVRTKSGHLQYRSPKGLRGQYVHRVVVQKLLEETPMERRRLIPWPYEVHHLDWVKTNNKPENLLLLPEAFHSCLTAHGRNGHDGRFVRGFHPRWKPASPQLDLFGDKDDKVPF